MFLKSLEIYGFKSFADRTHINFADGITALLGPNGCGKSNVVDAIKWVLAESKPKNLRAASKEDVIFNGTADRPSLSMAEVTLTIANEKGLLPIEESEIAIKRRLYRSGEDEYFINGQKKIAKDVTRLFMDTGVGKAAYSVMEQGKIDQILSSKPEDRRYLFEEAAGISRSKAEVAEAERELLKTEANLAQIESGLAETKRNYETLKVQAERTTKYRALNDQKFNYELDIQLLRLKDYTQNKARCEQNRTEAEQKRDAAAKDIEEIYATITENTDKIKTLQDRVNAGQQEAIKLAAEQTGKKDLSKQLRDQQTSLREKIGQIENRIKSTTERIEEYNEDIDAQNSELHEKNKRLTDINKNIESFTHNIQQCTGQIDENARQISTNAGKVHNLDSERAHLQKQLAAITEDIVTELDAKLKDAGYSSASNKKAKEELYIQLEKVKIFANGRLNIFKDFSSIPNHSAEDATQIGNDAVKAFGDVLQMLADLSASIEKYTQTTPQFIDDFLSPEGIITQKRNIDDAIRQNLEQIDAIEEESAALSEQNKQLSKKIDSFRETLGKLQINRAEMVQQINSCQQQINTLRKSLATEETSLKDQQDELFQETKRKESLEEQVEELDEQISELQQRGERITKELNELDRQIADCNSKASGKQNALQKKQEERKKYQEQLEKFIVSIAQNETEIKAIKQNFQENYSRDLMEFEERMYTITAHAADLREKLSETKQKIAELGNVNFSAIDQFAEEKERFERQQKSFLDTKKTVEDLRRVNAEIKSKSADMFIETYNKIKKNFHNRFRQLMSGGNADLRLVDPANVLTTGIEIYAQPPGKKLTNISLLSGGEKTMTAIALLFATYQVHPSPFCLLDEIDAALDNANVLSFVNALRSFASVSQYIVITHNTKTALGAYTMIGVTMEKKGITKVVQMRKDEDTLNGNLPYDPEPTDFVDEDVPPEEGIVIPPRPPRREHNPDGSLKNPPTEEKNIDVNAHSVENRSEADAAPSEQPAPAEENRT